MISVVIRVTPFLDYCNIVLFSHRGDEKEGQFALTHVLLAKKGSDVTVAQMKSRENMNEPQALKERSRIHEDG